MPCAEHAYNCITSPARACPYPPRPVLLGGTCLGAHCKPPVTFHDTHTPTLPAHVVGVGQGLTGNQKPAAGAAVCIE